MCNHAGDKRITIISMQQRADFVALVDNSEHVMMGYLLNISNIRYSSDKVKCLKSPLPLIKYMRLENAIHRFACYFLTHLFLGISSVPQDH